MVYERLPSESVVSAFTTQANVEIVTTRNYVLEDPVHRREHPDAESHPSVTHVTKSLPVALLRTCRLVYAEARPFVETRLRGEPSRYLFDAPSIRWFLYGSPLFNLFNEIRRNEHEFSIGSDCPPTLEEVVQRSQRGRRDFTANFPNPTASAAMRNCDPDYAPVNQFVLQCARWNVLANRELYNVTSPSERYTNIRLCVRIPPNSADADMQQLLNSCMNLIAWFGTGNRHRMCIVVQPSTGKNQQRAAELHETVQQMIDTRVEKWRKGGVLTQLYRVEQPGEEEWKKEWEEGYTY